MNAEIYAAYHTDDAVRCKSSSGGTFAALASAFLRRGGHVYGAELAAEPNGNWACRHVRCDYEAELGRILRSKYMPSDAEDVFPEIRERLAAGESVLFCGTPCQVAGLLGFLGKAYENLTTVDLFCHGVPTPLLLRKLIAETEETARAKVVRFNFRDKGDGWRNPRFSAETENGQTIANRGTQLYITNFFLRNSCYRCRFKGWERKGDLTLGDFWGVEEYLPLGPDDLRKGVSIVVVRTRKGSELFSAAGGSLSARPVGPEALRNKNPLFWKSPFRPLDKALYERLFFRLKTDSLLKLYGGSRGLREFTQRNLAKVGRVFRRLRPKRIRDARRLPPPRDCCGCMACYASCPFGAISIREDRFGFRYPLVSPSLCRRCGRCLSACPLTAGKTAVEHEPGTEQTGSDGRRERNV